MSPSQNWVPLHGRHHAESGVTQEHSKTTEWYSLLEDFFKLLTVFEKAQSKGNQAQEIKRFLYSLIQLMMNCIC